MAGPAGGASFCADRRTGSTAEPNTFFPFPAGTVLTRAPDQGQAGSTIRDQPALRSSWFIFSRSLATRLIASRIAGFVATRRLKSSARSTSSWQ